MTSLVTETPAASAEIALLHFESRLAFETDCWDVYDSMKAREPDFVLVDVRGREAFAQAHVAGAINIPHRTMTREQMGQFPDSALFVVYCAGPHCNGAHKAAVRLAKWGYRVKEMIGGVTGWREEGFPFEAEQGSAQVSHT
jgi:rhodanese-related sulfurtransferase